MLGTISTSSGGESGSVLFELGLPVAFNGRFLFLGNGGFAGSLQAVQGGQFFGAIVGAFAAIATDTGHESLLDGLAVFDGSFGLLLNGQPNLAAREDFSYRAVHLSTVAGETISHAYYAGAATPMRTSYFSGCSTGGRQAMVEAQKFPHDFNGIIAGDPAINEPIAGFIMERAGALGARRQLSRTRGYRAG